MGGQVTSGEQVAPRLPGGSEPGTVAGMVTVPPSAPAAFPGFPDARGDFFLALALHNDRDWFQAHRAEYEQGWAQPMASLMDEVRAGLRGAYGKRELGAPKVFRIHRDIRFSKDKTPYKTHVAGWLVEQARAAAPVVSWLADHVA
jgi:uncharacterized protein (DUF2461 family)